MCVGYRSATQGSTSLAKSQVCSKSESESKASFSSFVPQFHARHSCFSKFVVSVSGVRCFGVVIFVRGTWCVCLFRWVVEISTHCHVLSAASACFWNCGTSPLVRRATGPAVRHYMVLNLQSRRWDVYRYQECRHGTTRYYSSTLCACAHPPRTTFLCAFACLFSTDLLCIYEYLPSSVSTDLLYVPTRISPYTGTEKGHGMGYGGTRAVARERSKMSDKVLDPRP